MAHIGQEPGLSPRGGLCLLFGLHQLELGHLDLGNIQHADLPETPVIIEERDHVDKCKDGVVFAGSKGQFALPAACLRLFIGGIFSNTVKQPQVLFGEQVVYGRADDQRFVLDLQQLDRAFIAIGDDQRFRIQDEYAVKGSIENSIGKLFFFQDSRFIIPVDAENGIGKEGGQQ